MTLNEFRGWLKKRALSSSLATVAKAHHLNPSLVQMVASGARDPSAAFLAAFGMERPDEIRKIKGDKRHD